MNIFKKEDNDFIVLKDGYNKGLISGLIVLIIVVCGLVSTKIWMPDSRTNMTLDNTVDMNFKDTIINVEKGYYWNKQESIAQINLKEMCIAQTEEKVNVIVKQNKENKMPVKIIKGNSVPEEEGSMVTVTDYIVQFAMPKDTYYMYFTIAKGDMSYNFTIDYRDFKVKAIKELTENYLVDTQNYTNQILELEEKEKALKEEQDSINAMNEDEKKEKESRSTEISAEMEKAENEKQVLKRKIEILKEGIDYGKDNK